MRRRSISWRSRKFDFGRQYASYAFAWIGILKPEVDGLLPVKHLPSQTEMPMKPLNDSGRSDVKITSIMLRALLPTIAILMVAPTVSLYATTDASEPSPSEVVEARQFASEYDRLNYEAAELIIASDWGPAFEKLNQSIKLDPGRADAYFIYGRAHFLRGEYKASEMAFRKTQEIDPSVPAAWFEHAKLMVMKGDTNEALKSVRKAIALTNAQEWKYLTLLGEVYAEMGHRQSAEKAFDDAMTVLQDRIKSINQAISALTQEEEILEIIQETEMVYSQATGDIIEVPSVRYRTQAKTAPTEWTNDQERLKRDLETVEARKLEIVAWMESDRKDRSELQPDTR